MLYQNLYILLFWLRGKNDFDWVVSVAYPHLANKTARISHAKSLVFLVGPPLRSDLKDLAKTDVISTYGTTTVSKVMEGLDNVVEVNPGVKGV
jgi:hypothetical protein